MSDRARTVGEMSGAPREWREPGSSSRRCRPCRRPRRRGVMLVVTIVCLLVITALLGALLQNTVRFRRQLLVERDLRQTELLLRAGVDRAKARWHSDAAFRQETWQVPAEEILGTAAGSVELSVMPAAGGQPARLMVVAEYPLGGTPSVRRSLVLPLPVKVSTESEKESVKE